MKKVLALLFALLLALGMAAGAAAEAALAALSASLTFPTEEEAAKELAAAGAAKERAEREAGRAQAEASARRTARDRAAALIGRYDAELPDLRARAAGRERAYRAAMEERKLTEADWRALTARYPKTEIETIRERADDWRRRQAAAERLRSAAVQRYIPEKLRSRVNAFLETMMMAAGSVLSLLVGLLGEVMDYRLCVTVCGFVTLIACWLFIFGGRKEVRKVYEGA